MVRWRPGVWTTCLLFFQVMLLAGYSYAHLVVLRLSARAQGILHGCLLLASLALLPITSDASWKAVDAGDPTWPTTSAACSTCYARPHYSQYASPHQESGTGSGSQAPRPKRQVRPKATQ